jgi:hypothetical protein
MSHWFDEAAVRTTDGEGITRREGVRRTAAGLVAVGLLGSLGELKWPATAAARETPCEECYRTSRKRYAKNIRYSLRYGSVVGSFGGAVTFVTSVGVALDDILTCQADSCNEPPPQQGTGCATAPRVVGRAEASCAVVPPTTTPPPVSSDCLNCQEAGGKCCIGAFGELCACANPSLDCCERYGCCT